MIPWIFPGQWQLEIAMSYCALLLPLIVGLPPLMAIMEGVFAMTGREIWKQIARFWGELFAIALYLCLFGVLLIAVGYFLVGGALTGAAVTVFGAVLIALLGEIFLLRRYFRDWWVPSRLQHLAATLLMALLPNLAMLAIAIVGSWATTAAATGWDSNAQMMRILDMRAVLLNPVAQLRFLHLTSACYLTAATLVLSISAFYLLHDRSVQIARRSMTVAASFGLAAALSLAIRGGAMGFEGSTHSVMMLWSFRMMLLAGIYLMGIFAAAFYFASRHRLNTRGFLRLAGWSLPLPWLAMALGWVATEIRDDRWNPERISSITAAQAQLTAIVFGFIVLVALLVFVARATHIVRGGHERLKLWSADAGKAAG